MIFVQSILISYSKDVRYPDYADERKNRRFYPVFCDMPDKDAEALVDTVKEFQTPAGFFGAGRSTKTYGSEIFGNKDWYNLPADNVVKVVRQDDGYRLIYRSYDKNICTLRKNEYARIMYNYRYVERETGQWTYNVCIMNYLNADREKFREKIFYRKTPDYEFKDMQYMHYC